VGDSRAAGAAWLPECVVVASGRGILFFRARKGRVCPHSAAVMVRAPSLLSKLGRPFCGSVTAQLCGFAPRALRAVRDGRHEVQYKSRPPHSSPSNSLSQSSPLPQPTVSIHVRQLRNQDPYSTSLSAQPVLGGFLEWLPSLTRHNICGLSCHAN